MGKVSVFETYAVCAALLAGFASSIQLLPVEELAKQLLVTRIVTCVQQMLIRIVTIGAIHAMLVFMFASLYSKTALAREKFGMEVYEKYSEQTAAIRTAAFWTMYYSALMYVL